jgi:hypothetical protein
MQSGRKRQRYQIRGIVVLSTTVDHLAIWVSTKAFTSPGVLPRMSAMRFDVLCERFRGQLYDAARRANGNVVQPSDTSMLTFSIPPDRIYLDDFRSGAGR